MAAKSIKTVRVVYQRLQAAYQEGFGSSPIALLDTLNAEYKEELDDARSRSKASSRRDLISDKTLRDYFNASADDPPSLTEKNLNYLCGALLGYESYQEAKIRLLPVDDSSQPWLKRYYDYLRKEHSKVRIPKMTNVTELSRIYTESTVSEELQFRKNKSITELQAEMQPNYVPNRRRIAVSKVFLQYPRLMLWGAAGTGKTTALRALLLDRINQPVDEHVSSRKIVVFIELRQRLKLDSDRTLTGAIAAQLMHGETNAAISAENSRDRASSLLQEGRLLILLDGLDEVPKNILGNVQQEIDDLVSNYPDNRFVLTCRYGATEFRPSNFKEIEITSFDSLQVEHFINAWFSQAEHPDLAIRLVEHLRENEQIRDLARFPLMLTMLCAMYERGYGFPKEEISLFDEATELYLRSWDTFRRIEHRNEIYNGKLSCNRRRNLFSKLAFEGLSSYEEPRYFWKRTTLEMFIKKFIGDLPDGKEDSTDSDARAILNALESQDSLLTRTSADAYTFSYRGFQEYLTAMRIVEEAGADVDKLKALLDKHALKPEWSKVLYFTAERLPLADDFLILLFQLSLKQINTDKLVESFTWWDLATEKAGVASSLWRACYATFDFKTDLHLSRKLSGIDEKRAQRVSSKLRDINKANNLIIDRTPMAQLYLDLAAIHAMVKDRAEGIPVDTKIISFYDKGYENTQKAISDKLKSSIELARELRPQLGHALAQLLSHFPTDETALDQCNQWADRLRAAMIEHLYESTAGNEEPTVLSGLEIDSLNDYLRLVEILVDCLQSDIYCSKALRKELIASLMLPPGSDKISERLLMSD